MRRSCFELQSIELVAIWTFIESWVIIVGLESYSTFCACCWSKWILCVLYSIKLTTFLALWKSVYLFMSLLLCEALTAMWNERILLGEDKTVIVWTFWTFKWSHHGVTLELWKAVFAVSSKGFLLCELKNFLLATLGAI